MGTVVKETSMVNCQIDPKVGYTIRIRGFTGATFTVDFDGNIVIGQSSRMRYPLETWKLIQDEIEQGKLYVAKMKLSGARNNIQSPTTIKPSQYKNLTLYKDVKGRGILYLTANGLDLSSPCGNRQGCKVVYAVFQDYRDIKDIQRLGDVIYI